MRCLRCGAGTTVDQDFVGDWQRCADCGLQWTMREDGGGVDSACENDEGEWREVPDHALPVFGWEDAQ